MSFVLAPAEVADLTLAQKRAILTSFYLALAVDRQVEDAERAALEREVRQVPWGLDDAAIHEVLAAARTRVEATTARPQWTAWVEELARDIPEALRLKVLGTMATIAAADQINQLERGLLNLFAITFGLSQETADRMKAELGAALAQR